MYFVKFVFEPSKNEMIIRSNDKGLYDPLMDQGWALTLWRSALVSLEFIGMIFVLIMEKHYRGFFYMGQLGPPRAFKLHGNTGNFNGSNWIWAFANI